MHSSTSSTQRKERDIQFLRGALKGNVTPFNNPHLEDDSRYIERE